MMIRAEIRQHDLGDKRQNSLQQIDGAEMQIQMLFDSTEDDNVLRTQMGLLKDYLLISALLQIFSLFLQQLRTALVMPILLKNTTSCCCF